MGNPLLKKIVRVHVRHPLPVPFSLPYPLIHPVAGLLLGWGNGMEWNAGAGWQGAGAPSCVGAVVFRASGSRSRAAWLPPPAALPLPTASALPDEMAAGLQMSLVADQTRTYLAIML